MSDVRKVLIVDDEADSVAITESMLSEIEGLDVLSANDGDSGLAKAKEVDPDLMILDVQMPGKSGFDVFSELRRDDATKGIPVIMLTGVEEKTGIGFSSEEMGDFLGEKPQAYIEKPVDAEALQSTVKRLLGL